MEPVTESVWQKSKLIFKALLIGVMALLLLIPAYFVQQLVLEREARQKEAVQEVSSKWGGSQIVTPPVLVIPFSQTEKNNDGSAAVVTRYAYVLPDQLKIRSVVNPEKKSRSIYQVMLYSAGIHLEGSVSSLHLPELGIDPGSVQWNKIHLAIGLTDIHGLRDEINLTVNSTKLKMENIEESGLTGSNLAVTLPFSAEQYNAPLQFSADLNLNGSEQLQFVPVGKQTEMEMKSAWADPSFSGNQLPDTSWISDKGFTARWKSVAHNRPFAQYGMGAPKNLTVTAYGTDLYIQLNGYQKIIRSLKYAILCILLTFTAFFLIDSTNKKGVHPLQYALIGCALLLFYTLLLSISEYTSFNLAYWISTAATAGLIAWFVKSLLRSGALTLVMTLVLVLLYGYVFTILQLEDYALLLGSIGLFMTLGGVMYFTRKLRW